MNWLEYHSQDDIESYLDYLVENYDFAQTETIGESYEGRKMRVLKICKEACGSKPAMWIDGGIHAREWITPAVATWIIKELIEEDSSHPELTDNLDWYILPIVNPDGYEFSRTEDRIWRKSRSPTYASPICDGTDLNRNWGFHWNEGGATNSACGEDYHGAEAFSEVENRNIRDFVWERRDKIKFFMSLHSFSQLILIPWAFNYELPPGFTKLKSLADKANEVSHPFQYSKILHHHLKELNFKEFLSYIHIHKPQP